eukprot:21432_1
MQLLSHLDPIPVRTIPAVASTDTDHPIPPSDASITKTETEIIETHVSTAIDIVPESEALPTTTEMPHDIQSFETNVKSRVKLHEHLELKSGRYMITYHGYDQHDRCSGVWKLLKKRYLFVGKEVHIYVYDPHYYTTKDANVPHQDSCVTTEKGLLSFLAAQTNEVDWKINTKRKILAAKVVEEKVDVVEEQASNVMEDNKYIKSEFQKKGIDHESDSEN